MSDGLVMQLARLRREHRLTRKQVARRLGTRTREIRYLEEGRKDRDYLSTIRRYALAVGALITWEVVFDD